MVKDRLNKEVLNSKFVNINLTTIYNISIYYI